MFDKLKRTGALAAFDAATPELIREWLANGGEDRRNRLRAELGRFPDPSGLEVLAGGELKAALERAEHAEQLVLRRERELAAARDHGSAETARAEALGVLLERAEDVAVRLVVEFESVAKMLEELNADDAADELKAGLRVSLKWMRAHHVRLYELAANRLRDDNGRLGTSSRTWAGGLPPNARETLAAYMLERGAGGEELQAGGPFAELEGDRSPAPRGELGARPTRPSTVADTVFLERTGHASSRPRLQGLEALEHAAATAAPLYRGELEEELGAEEVEQLLELHRGRTVPRAAAAAVWCWAPNPGGSDASR